MTTRRRMPGLATEWCIGARRARTFQQPLDPPADRGIWCRSPAAVRGFRQVDETKRVGRAWGELLLYYTLGSDPALWPAGERRERRLIAHDKGYYHAYTEEVLMPDYPTLIPKTSTPTPETLPGGGIQLPALFSPDAATAQRVLEFFTANIRNPHTRKAYATAVRGFAAWTDTIGIAHLRYVKPLHVAAYIEQLQSRLAAPSVKLQLAAIRMLFDWLVVGQIVPTNPASAVRGPKHSLKKGKTPALTAEEARDLLDSIATRSPVGLRDRALIALMIYTFARVGAVLKMRLEDVFTQGRHTWVRLHEKGGKHHQMPCHHKLESYLQQYIDTLEATALEAGSPLDSKAWTFPTAAGRSGRLSNRPMGQADVYRMIRRRALDAGIETKIGCHSFRATGITEYLRNGGKLEVAQQMANHESARTTGLYDRRNDQVSLDEVERILI